MPLLRYPINIDIAILCKNKKTCIPPKGNASDRPILWHSEELFTPQYKAGGWKTLKVVFQSWCQQMDENVFLNCCWFNEVQRQTSCGLGERINTPPATAAGGSHGRGDAAGGRGSNPYHNPPKYKTISSEYRPLPRAALLTLHPGSARFGSFLNAHAQKLP